MSAEESDTNQFPTTRGLTEGRSVGAGRYVLKQFLGQGGMGLVWLARDSRLSDDVALKFLPSELRLDPTALDDLRSETLKSRKLAHPHIIRIHDLYEGKNEDPFISMEYVDGPTLSRRRVQQPTRVLEWEELSRLVRQLCEALEYAHNEQVIHRDLKPANLMLDSRQRIKLADFGIARVVTDSFSRITMRHGTSGTLVYMSPQQLDGRPSNATDDIYSVGATLYELLTSKPPFFTGEIAHQIRYVPPDPINDRLHQLRIMTEVPPLVSDTIGSCLAKNPSERPQSARELADRLGLTRGPSGTSKSRQSKKGTEPAPGQPPEEPERKPLRFLWPALLLGTAAVATISSFYLGKHTSPGELAPKSQSSNSVPVATAPLVPLAALTNPAPKSPATAQTSTSTNAPASAIIPFTPPPSPPVTNNFAPVAVVTSSPPAPVPAKTTSPPVAVLPATPSPAPAPPSAAVPAAPKIPQAGRAWTNSLDMRFAPIPGTAALLSVWDTRVSDYAEFVNNAPYTNDSKWRNLDFAAVPANPVVYVNYDDATNFCGWLTARERRAGTITPNQFYRLPTDLEWSRAAGLPAEDGKTPKDRSDAIRKVYPWGSAWPPPAGAGNFAGAELTDKEMLAVRVIRGYSDGFTRLSPVGSFAATTNGFYDLVGNVQQWCSDEYEPPAQERVLRGSAWDSADNVEILLSHRNYLGPLYRQPNVGFRCVLDVSNP